MNIKKSVEDNSGSGKHAGGFEIKTYEAEKVGDAWSAKSGGVTKTETTDASGEIRWRSTYRSTDLNGQNEQTYYYIVEEVIPATPANGWNYDSTRYGVEMKLTNEGTNGIAIKYQSVVKLNADGTVVANSEQTENTKTNVATLNFKNTYAAEKVELNLNVEPPISVKKLEGRNLVAGEFTFELSSTDTCHDHGALTITGTNEAAKAGEYAKIVFPASAKLTFTKVGRHVFTLKEVIETGKSVTYDDTVYHWIVEVTDNNGTLEAVHYFEESVDEQVEFTNTYSVNSVPVVIEGTKNLDGRVLHAHEFGFALYDANDTEISTTSNNADGTFKFDQLLITQADMGGEMSKTFTFTVKEIQPTGTDTKGVTYDPAEYTVSITVTDNGEGELTASTPTYTYKADANATESKSAEAIVFNNTYSAHFTSNFTITGSKQLIGRDWAEGETFEFFLLENGTVVKDAKVDDKNQTFSFTFGANDFTKPGAHHFVLAEVVPTEGAAGVIYDETEYEITIPVVDDGNGNLFVDIKEEESDNLVESISGYDFVNTYDPEEVMVVIEGKKTLTGREIKDGEFSFSLYRTDDKYNVIDPEPIWTVQNDKDGKFVSPDGVFHTAGTHHYILVEEPYAELKNGAYVSDNVTYDPTVYKVKIVISNQDMNDKYADALTAFVSVNVPGTNNWDQSVGFGVVTVEPTDDILVFTNKYTPNATPTPTSTPEPSASPAPTAEPSAEPTAEPTVEPTAAPEATATPKPQSGIPGTGDTANLTAWLVVLATAVVGAAATLLVVFRRKRTATGKHYR